jgi:hypothetical protein
MADRSASAGSVRPEFNGGSFISALLLWAFVAFFLVESFQFAPRARVLPQLVAVPLLLAATISLVREVRVVFLGKTARVGGRPAGEDEVAPRGWRAEAVPFIWLAVLIGLVLALGLLIGAIVFLVLFLRIYGRERWRFVIAMPVVFFVLIEFGFVEYFGFRVFPGYVLPALGVTPDFLGMG